MASVQTHTLVSVHTHLQSHPNPFTSQRRVQGSSLIHEGIWGHPRQSEGSFNFGLIELARIRNFNLSCRFLHYYQTRLVKWFSAQMFDFIKVWGLIYLCVFLSLSSPQTWSAWCTAASGQKSRTLMGAAPVTSKWQTTLTEQPPSRMPPQILGITATFCPPNNRRTDRWRQAGRRGLYPWQTRRLRWRTTDRAAVETLPLVGRGQSHLHRAPSPVCLPWGRDICRRVWVLRLRQQTTFLQCFLITLVWTSFDVQDSTNWFSKFLTLNTKNAKDQITCSVLRIQTPHVSFNSYYRAYRSLNKMQVCVCILTAG